MIYIIIADYYQVWQDPGWLAGETPPYYKTRDYAQNVKNEMSELIDYIRLRMNFETDGKYDPDKQVDILEYAEQGIISGSNTNGFAYTLQQLYDWSEQKESYKWWKSYIRENEKNLYSVSELKEIKGTLDELYTPQGYDSILEFVMSEQNLRRASEVHCASELAVCLLKIDAEMPQYVKDKERFKAENILSTGLRMWRPAWCTLTAPWKKRSRIPPDFCSREILFSWIQMYLCPMR